MLKKILRELILLSPFRFSRNLYYDKLTRKVIKSICNPHSNCIDVGCHKGEVMDIILKHASDGRHLAFEPIPMLAAKLKNKYRGKQVAVHAIALSNFRGVSPFNLVTTNPAYSGLLKRSYDRPEEDRTIQIQVAQLDDYVIKSHQVDLIKIDVEGGELDVMKGAIRTLERDHPVLIFEHGKGSAEAYQSGPGQLYDFLNQLQYRIYSLENFIGNRDYCLRNEFLEHFEKGTEYYFVAHYYGKK